MVSMDATPTVIVDGLDARVPHLMSKVTVSGL